MLHTGEAGGHGVGHESDGCCNNNYNNNERWGRTTALIPSYATLMSTG